MSTFGDLLAQGGFSVPLRWLDWVIILVFLLATTVVAYKNKGSQGGVRDFFLGNRDLPWLAVCFSLMATEVSAASYMGVPLLAYDGSLVYLQLAIGAIIARFVIGYYFVPAFYADEIYSPYQFMGRRFGLGAEQVTSGLFILGAVVGQSARIFILATVLQLIAGLPIVQTVLVVAAVAALWSCMGGIRTVVWTGVVQFAVLVIGALATGLYLITQADGGLTHILSQASKMGKLQLFDFRFDPALELTLWTGLFGSTFNVLASHGADQMNTQQLLCCRSARDARKAIIYSSYNQVFVLLLLLVGLGLYTYFQDAPNRLAGLIGSAGSASMFPFFIATVLPTGLKGLLVVGLLAAAISTVNATLAALGQTTLRWLNLDAPSITKGNSNSQVHYSRLFMVFWATVLATAALAFQDIASDSDLLSMALRLTSFTYGALLGSLLLAFSSSRRTSRGIVFGAPFAVLTAFGMIWHGAWAHYILIGGVAVLVVLWWYALFQEIEQLPRIKDDRRYVRHAWYLLVGEFPRTLWVLIAAVLALFTHWPQLVNEPTMPGQFEPAWPWYELAWPWYLPMGVGITIVFGYLLSRPVEADEA